MEKEPFLTICKLSGMAHIKNSTGKSDNLKFITWVRIDSSDNTDEIYYEVIAFENHKLDYFKERFENYGLAIDEYNRLATEWNANRPETWS